MNILLAKRLKHSIKLWLQCYDRKPTFVYEVEAAHARYLDSDPY